MTFFFLKLILAHLIGDFMLQPDAWVKHKRKRQHRSRYLYYHIATHALLLVVLLAFDLSFWKGILIILVSHYFIDLAKLFLERKRINSALLFAADQLAHIGVLTLVVFLYFPFELEVARIYTPETLLFALALLLVTFVGAVVIRQLMSRWPLPEDSRNDSLHNAGKYIGMLERLLVFCFILLEQWTAIGWLITAKSVFRFSDLTRAKDRKLTEYILIGTLLSFGFAIVVGVAYLLLKP